MNNKEESRELPWYVSDSEPTPQIAEKMVKKFPSYALHKPEISCYYATFYKCRDIVKDYFTERVKKAKGSKMQQIAEEAWKLVGQFVGLFEMGENQDLSRWNVLNDKWNTVIQKFKMHVNSGEQQEKPTETPSENATPINNDSCDKKWYQTILAGLKHAIEKGWQIFTKNFWETFFYQIFRRPFC